MAKHLRLAYLSSIQNDKVPFNRPTAAEPMQVALAWLLQRSPNILLIPGTSSVAYLRENLAAGELTLSSEDLAQLEELAACASACWARWQH